MPNPPHPLPHKPRIRHAFDQAAANYDAAADVQRECSDRLAAALQRCNPTLQVQTILDAGCGTGYSRHWLQQRWPQAQLVMLDFAPRMLQSIPAPTAHTLRICADLEALPCAAAHFNLYWSSLAWQWNRPEQCLAEAGRVLKAHGMLAVATLGSDNFQELRYAFHDLDRYQHVLNIADPARLLAACAGGAWRLHHWQRQPVRRYYRDLRGLLRHVKAVGASEVGERRPQPLTRRLWQTLVERYEHLRTEHGLPLTYDGIWLIAERLPEVE